MQYVYKPRQYNITTYRVGESTVPYPLQYYPTMSQQFKCRTDKMEKKNWLHGITGKIFVSFWKICKVNVTKRRSWKDIFNDPMQIATLVQKVRVVIFHFASVMMLCVVTFGNSQWPEFPIVPNYSTPTFLTQLLLRMKLCEK